MLISINLIFATPARVFWLAALSVAISGLAGPIIIYRLAKDGGFEHYGWNIDMGKWNDIKGYLGGQPIMHMDILTNEGGKVHNEMWINTGQKIVFRNVPATSATEFVSYVRVHPAWNPGDSLDPLIFRATARDGHMVTVADTRVEGTREFSGEWKKLTLDLSGYSGRKIDIEIMPISQYPGIWTLWRDPVVQVGQYKNK